MIELIIGGLIAFALMICFGALLGGRDSVRYSESFTKAELKELLSELPENTQIYIVIEKRRE